MGLTSICATALLQIKRLISEDLSERLEPQNLDNLRHAVVEENDVTEEMARAFGGNIRP